MKKNLILAASFAVAIFAAGCDSNTGNDNVTGAEATVTETPATAPVVENPNVAGAEGVVAPENAPVISFAETSYDFGTVKQGEVVEHTFKFTNTGKSPLVIESATATCGCTVPDKPDKPIAPGETGEIKVNFNSTGKAGMQAPVITVRANTVPNITQVTLKGTVEANNIPTAGADGPVKRN
ncbi:DUF1573 domain-containing protein [uncultured Pontibacter sp.]|uniref:DUF1573 domain-containing protein n=1 Tax=uncultured Pontibacter sp. TaxID=453356 RepID=UPI002618A622|nr:DUF1573 domain-containing protein [uncultured Pontibacter sp.]